ncbi:MAG: 30S ribosomal protein S18 [SAR324 cluster bacterium]|uniref:Small ribosomal subunit protein bS18 n=1 Tax=SAR324 cluster bacterium TaxID=2024889 RepID=A0A2A4TCM2_9DELT|nr:MAG: 30S ribosomal protein S18 [SAR324 cluster bacterium]
MAKKKRKQADRPQRRACPVRQAGVEEVDYKDIELLKLFITEKGKIIPRRISGLSSRSQKRITGAIKRARNIALLSFSEGYMPQESNE